MRAVWLAYQSSKNHTTMKKHGYVKTYFEEAAQEDILASDTFKKIANKQVDHFNIIGGGMYKVELCIYLEEE